MGAHGDRLRARSGKSYSKSSSWITSGYTHPGLVATGASGVGNKEGIKVTPGGEVGTDRTPVGEVGTDGTNGSEVGTEGTPGGEQGCSRDTWSDLKSSLQDRMAAVRPGRGDVAPLRPGAVDLGRVSFSGPGV